MSSRRPHQWRKYPVAAVYFLIFLATYLFVVIDSYVTPDSIAGVWLIPATFPWSLVIVFLLPDWSRPFLDLFFFAIAALNALLIGIVEHRCRARRGSR